MAEPLIAFTVRLPVPVYSRLQAEVERRQEPVEEVVAEALSDYLSIITPVCQETRTRSRSR